MSSKEKLEKLKPLVFEKYENWDLDRLIMYTMGRLAKMKLDLSYENAVVAAFKLFPKKFSLPGFPNYPDSNRVMHCLSRCTLNNRKWLGGKLRQGFFLTERSEKIISEVEELLESKITKKAGSNSKTRRKETIISEVKKSKACIKYFSNEQDSITDAEVCFYYKQLWIHP